MSGKVSSPFGLVLKNANPTNGVSPKSTHQKTTSLPKSNVPPKFPIHKAL